MAKKKRSSYTSKGERKNVGSVGMVRKSPFDRALDKVAAWKAGKNPWVTIETSNRNARFVRVRSNALWGDPKGKRATGNDE